MDSSRTVYAAHLPLVGDPAKNRAAARALARRQVASEIGGWPAGQSPQNCAFTSRCGHRITCRSATASRGESIEQFWEMVVVSPHKDPTLRWRATILVGGDEVKAWVQVRYGIEPAPGCDRVDGFIGFDAMEPALVGVLVDRLDVRDAGWRHTVEPWVAATGSDVEQVAAFIAHPSRRLPVVLTTRTPGAPLSEDAVECARMTSGIGHVVDIETTEGARHLEECLGGQFEQTLGTWRIFFAGWSPSDAWSHHPMWSAERQRGDRWGSFGHVTARKLFAISAFRTVVPSVVHRASAAHAAQRMAALRAGVRGTTERPTLTDDMLNEWESDLASRELAERELEEARVEIGRLAAVNQALIRGAADVVEIGEGGAVDEFATVLEAVEAAAERFPQLTVLQRALQSASECHFMRPRQVYEDLAALAGIVDEWRSQGRVPGGWSKAAAQAGLSWCNNISDTAQTKYRADYEATLDDGTKVILGPHFKRGAGGGGNGHYRCYLHIDDQAQRVMVGYVGPHLRDYGNG